jgi:hypothetical protein
MTHDPLGKLLSRADAIAGTAGRPSADLARRVRAEARRRNVRNRVAIGSVSALALLLAVLVPSLRPSRTEWVNNTPTPSTEIVKTSPPRPDTADLAAEIATIRADAAGREAVVTAMLGGEARGRRAIAAPTRIDPLDRILAEQDRGALAIVRQADRQYRELDRKASAAAAYGRVVELFPKTHWAAVARQRLSDIGG